MSCYGGVSEQSNLEYATGRSVLLADIVSLTECWAWQNSAEFVFQTDVNEAGKTNAFQSYFGWGGGGMNRSAGEFTATKISLSWDWSEKK